MIISKYFILRELDNHDKFYEIKNFNENTKIVEFITIKNPRNLLLIRLQSPIK